MHRRDLIKLSAGAALVAKAAAPHRFFTEAEYQVVDQLTEMIIPADDKSGEPRPRASPITSMRVWRRRSCPKIASDGARV